MSEMRWSSSIQMFDTWTHLLNGKTVHGKRNDELASSVDGPCTCSNVFIINRLMYENIGRLSFTNKRWEKRLGQNKLSIWPPFIYRAFVQNKENVLEKLISRYPLLHSEFLTEDAAHSAWMISSLTVFAYWHICYILQCPSTWWVILKDLNKTGHVSSNATSSIGIFFFLRWGNIFRSLLFSFHEGEHSNWFFHKWLLKNSLIVSRHRRIDE